MSREIRIATRKSALALWQAEYVKARLEAAHPGLVVTLVPMVSRGAFEFKRFGSSRDPRVSRSGAVL